MNLSSRIGAKLRYARPVCRATPAGVESLALLQGVEPAAPRPDFIRLMRRVDVFREPSRFVVDSEAGWKCDHASDPNACVARLDQLVPEAPLDGSFDPFVLVVQRADEQTVVRAWPELAALLGPVDSLEEALLYARLRGFESTCEASSGERAGDDWMLALSRSTRCGQGTYAVRVARSGELFVVEAHEDGWRGNCVRYAPKKEGPNSWLENR